MVSQAIDFDPGVV